MMNQTLNLEKRKGLLKMDQILFIYIILINKNDF